MSGPAGSGGFALAHTHPDRSPVTYDPCRPIHYVVNAASAPAGGEKFVRRAVDRVQLATGLQFVDDGTTSEKPSEHRRTLQLERYGNQWTPVLIAWADEDRYPELVGAVAGLGGSAWIGSGDDTHYVTGQIVLDRATFRLDTTSDTAIAIAIVLHELGHLVGLAHVPDPTQLMYRETVPGVSNYAAGDLRGLALLGAGRCRPQD